MIRQPRACAFLLLLAALLVAGCGAKKVKVTGKVHKGGQALASKTGSVLITLVPEGKASAEVTTIPIRANPDGTFAAEDVPPGKYKIAVAQEESPGSDLLGGAFSQEKTKIVRDIDGKAPLDIDVSKPGG